MMMSTHCTIDIACEKKDFHDAAVSRELVRTNKALRGTGGDDADMP